MTVQNPLSREVFWHEYAKIPRHARQNSITKGDFIEFWLRICEGTEQIQNIIMGYIDLQIYLDYNANR